jgi:hypothetical protein
MDWLISPEARRFIITNGLFFPLLFVARLIGFTPRPTRTVIYWKVSLYDLARLRRLPALWTARPGAFVCGSGCRIVEIILSEYQLACLKAAVPTGSVARAALEAGDYFAGDEIAPEPVAVRFTCTMEIAEQLFAIARAACPDVASGIRAAIDQQAH